MQNQNELYRLFIGLLALYKETETLFLAKRGRRPRVAGFIILSLKGLRRDEISCGVYGHIYLFIYLFIYLWGWCMPEMTSHGRALVA